MSVIDASTSTIRSYWDEAVELSAPVFEGAKQAFEYTREKASKAMETLITATTAEAEIVDPNLILDINSYRHYKDSNFELKSLEETELMHKRIKSDHAKISIASTQNQTTAVNLGATAMVADLLLTGGMGTLIWGATGAAGGYILSATINSSKVNAAKDSIEAANEHMTGIDNMITSIRASDRYYQPTIGPQVQFSSPLNV